MPTTNQREGREQDCRSIPLSDLKFFRSKELELMAVQRFKLIIGNDTHNSQEPRDRMKSVLELIFAACQVAPYVEVPEEHQRIVLSNRIFEYLICRLDELAVCQVAPYGEEPEEHQRIALSNRIIEHLICRLDEDKINALKMDSYQDIRVFLNLIKKSCEYPTYLEAVTWRIDCFLSTFDEVIATENNS